MRKNSFVATPLTAIILMTILTLFLFSCSPGHPPQVEDPALLSYPPESAGPYQFSVETDSVFPAYMTDVRSLSIRTPLLDSPAPLPTIIIEPGFFSVATDLEDIENRYASHGFLVIGITNTSHFNLITTTLTSYKSAFLQTVQYTLASSRNSSSRLFGRIDTNAIGISGHSMGGGGVIMACDSIQFDYNRFIKTAIAMNPFGNCTGENIRIPMFLFSSDLDAVFNPFMPGVSSSPQDIYSSFQSIPSGNTKLFANYKNMDHNAVVDENFLLATSGNANVFLPSMVSWFKVYLAQDEAYRSYVDTNGVKFQSLRSRFVAKGTVPGYLYSGN